jgi:curved DNA-binding protein CbpA
MTEANPYVLMGVGQAASKEEIHHAYRKLAKRYHPDLNPGDATAERSFKEIAAAYELLSDPLERARFDREFSDGIAGSGLHDGGPTGATAGDAVHASHDTRTAPRSPAAADPFEFRRARTVEDTGFDPDKGYEIAEPDDRVSRSSSPCSYRWWLSCCISGPPGDRRARAWRRPFTSTR